MGLADVHAHLTSPRMTDVAAAITRAREAGVTTIISNGLCPRDNERVRELAAAHALVKPAFGLYPVDAVLAQMRAAGVPYPHGGEDEPECSAEQGIAFVRAHASEACAIGEIGLDGHWVPSQFWEAQEEVFCALVRIAMEADKPVIVHTRKREQRTLALLRELGATRVNWHCFGGKVKLAREIAEHGHFLSIPANARRSESFTRMLQTLPRDRVLLETDCPYLGPTQGQPSEPADVAGTAAYAAELWKATRAEVEARLAENFFRLFGFPP